MSELTLNLGADARQEPAFVARATDPVVSNVGTPADFAAQFPNPLNTHEIIAMCEETNLWRNIPAKPTDLKVEYYREMNELAFTSGSSYTTFADGACPEEYEHDGDNATVTLKNIGAKKSLTLSDIKHSAAVAGLSRGPYGVGIGTMVDGFPSSEGFPGGSAEGVFGMQAIADLKAKEMLLASVLVMNGWDRLMVLGNSSSNALEFDGIENLISSGTGSQYNLPASISGTFSAADYDRFLAEGCARAQLIAGHPTAIQEMMSGYFQLGFQGSQVVNFNGPADRIIPGYNFAGEVNTGVGRMRVVADSNFTRTALAGGTTFQSSLYSMRMTHNGEPLVYRADQFPLSFQDLAPGCTAISFEVWAKTALIVKAKCAHGKYTKVFSGRVTTTCPVVGLTND